MQKSPQQLKNRLIEALDEDNNVVNMPQVLEVISILETFKITRQALEQTRIGKHINELRKKTSDTELAKRAKCLVREWQKLLETTDNKSINGNSSQEKRSMPKLNTSLSSRASSPRCSISPAISPRLVDVSRSSLSLHKQSHPTSPSVRHPSPLSSSPNSLKPSNTSQNLTTNNNSHNCDKIKPNNVLKHNAMLINKNDKLHNVSLGSHSPLTTDASRKRPHCNSDNHEEIPTKIAALIPAKSSKRRYKKYKEKINGVSVHSPQISVTDFDKLDPVPSYSQSTSIIDSDNKSKLPKVKTTAEIIATLQKNANLSTTVGKNIDLVEREADDLYRPVVPSEVLPRSRRKDHLLPVETKTKAKMSRTKAELVEKFLETSLQPADLSPIKPDTSPEPSPHEVAVESQSYSTQESEISPLKSSYNKQNTYKDFDAVKSDGTTQLTSKLDISPSDNNASLTLLELFAQLPPLNVDEINYDDGYSETKPSSGDDDDVKRLHTDQWPGVNGMSDHDSQWHDWTQTLSMISYNHEPLHILPYVVIDKYPPLDE